MSALFICLLLRALCAGGDALKGFRPCAGCGRALPCTRDFFGKKSSKNFITPAGGMKGAVLFLGAGAEIKFVFFIISDFRRNARAGNIGKSGLLCAGKVKGAAGAAP